MKVLGMGNNFPQDAQRRLATLCGVDPKAVAYVPSEGGETADPAVLAQIQDVVKDVVQK